MYAIQLYNFNLMKSIKSQITKNCGIFLLALLHLLWWLKNLCCRSRNLENYHNEGFERSFPTFRSQIFFLPGIRTFWRNTTVPPQTFRCSCVSVEPDLQNLHLKSPLKEALKLAFTPAIALALYLNQIRDCGRDIQCM